MGKGDSRIAPTFSKECIQSRAYAAGSGVVKKARTECEQGRKWVVENYNGQQDIVVAETNPKQTVYIYNCTNSTIQASKLCFC